MEQNTRGEDEIIDSTLSDSSSMNNETAVSNRESKGDNEVLEEQSQGFDNESNLEEQMNTSLHINEDVKIQDNYNINFEECNIILNWVLSIPLSPPFSIGSILMINSSSFSSSSCPPTFSVLELLWSFPLVEGLSISGLLFGRQWSTIIGLRRVHFLLIYFLHSSKFML